jgi:hypothetical protein
MADLSHLDKNAIQAFLDGDVGTFINDLKLIQQDDPNDVQALKSIAAGFTTPETEGMVSADKPLAIGDMATDQQSLMDGKNVTTAVINAIGAIVTILEGQSTLFGDIHDNLETTITELMDTQGSNLSSIDGADFLNDLSDVDSDLGSGGSSTSGGSTSTKTP